MGKYRSYQVDEKSNENDEIAQAVCIGSQVLQMVVNLSRDCFSHLPLQFFFLILTSQKFPKFLPKTSQKSPKNDFENPNPQILPKFKLFWGVYAPKNSFFQKAICPRVNSLILKRAISHILPQLPFYLLFSPLPVLLFLLISSFSLSISQRIGHHTLKSCEPKRYNESFLLFPLFSSLFFL